jgi:hypothetical protein
LDAASKLNLQTILDSGPAPHIELATQEKIASPDKFGSDEQVMLTIVTMLTPIIL